MNALAPVPGDITNYGQQPQQPVISDAQLEQLLAGEISRAQSYVYSSDDIYAERERNYDYYRGIMQDLPTVEGRSRVVDRTVSEYIGMMLPQLCRVFSAGRYIGEYEPPSAENKEDMKLITKYVNDVVLRKDNNFDLIMVDWALNALLQKLGVVKVWWEKREETKSETFTGLNDAQVMAAAAQVMIQGKEIVAYTETPGPEGTLADITIKTTTDRSKVCIYNLAPEEFCISWDAQTFEDAVLLSHRSKMKSGHLIAMGIPKDIVDTLPTYFETTNAFSTQYQSQQYLARNPSQDPDLRDVLVHQGIIKCDRDGEGIKPWFFLAGGDQSRVTLLECEPYDYQVVFAGFCPKPLPNRVIGRCPADDLAEIQKVNTVLVRQMLDNLYLSNTPQREVVQSMILKPDQLMNMAPGAPIFVSAPGAIREIAVPFVADKAMVALQYFDSKAESRSGVTKMAAGIEPSVLQNQSATAASIAYSASVGQLEFIARIWARGGMRDLFRGILNILIRYQDFSRVTLIDGESTQVDPRSWGELGNADVVINTGLGTGARDRDMSAMAAVMQMQAEFLKNMGPNPSVTPEHIVNAMQKFIESSGIVTPELFVSNMPKQQDGSPWFPTPQKPEPSPDTLVNAQTLKEIENTKTMAKQQTDIYVANLKAAENAQELEYKYAELGLEAVAKDAKAATDIMTMQRDRARDDADIILRAADVDLKERQAKRQDEKDDEKEDEGERKGGHGPEMAAALQAIAKAIGPKKIIRDKNGKATGTEAAD